ncbi:MAG: cbb3-type cytochrome c oxidase subunit I [Algoriphagus sp.]|uniref:cbb3-type cytochrome c oxidase subunit I n=1 Tax=Algoriphagus sp. TaxID=1872435 RepID=UPI0027316C0C|nr:cbb3-type cytochrome c oxidase subunit I [Algoriphagus sp.]MDP2043509.1 cbb3-type cytochrome c oxidase subunit I [Algoriphagus sp.]MDP3472441.1 cbb3-type cytochrome c oxidase subunit I [Algoriphagus sp.]
MNERIQWTSLYFLGENEHSCLPQAYRKRHTLGCSRSAEADRTGYVGNEKNINMKRTTIILFLLGLSIFEVQAQTVPNPNTAQWWSSPGIIGTALLIAIVSFVAIIIIGSRLSTLIQHLQKKTESKNKESLKSELINLEAEELDLILEKRKAAKTYSLTGKELTGPNSIDDGRGLVTKITHDPENPFVDEKMRETLRLETPEALRNLLIWYLGAAVFWLVFGTLVGQYVGMKFIWPEMDQSAWLSFGRLRPVHTNTVFWGWASLAMVGLGYFVISRTSNTSIFSYTVAKVAWYLMNSAVLVGNILLMSGVNNGGGEYREYIWPVALLFALGLILTCYNFYKTVADRKISEIYISNWYLMGGLMWTITLVVIGYLPSYQDGLGETVIQGYYMHQGVGMWFMTFTLGLVYYYLPTALNKPIYSYSLGVLAFWTQMLFYTLIGTHHFVFSPLPWWLQTVAIVFSVGMFIPVLAGTTNFLMTMKGSWSAISKSYVLPFFLVGVVFYFVGSTQGSLQAFRLTNFIWHFTDFNVAHSHMTMYGIITFLLWACMYSIVPKVTGNEPPGLGVGIHFWMAFVGLFAYMISLMAGGTLRGLSWIEGEPFIQSVVLMQPYWVWRAIGGSLMFVSHLVFAYNFYEMAKKDKRPPVRPTTPFSSAQA